MTTSSGCFSLKGPCDDRVTCCPLNNFWIVQPLFVIDRVAAHSSLLSLFYFTPVSMGFS